MALVVVVPLLAVLFAIFVIGTATISQQLSAGITGWLKDAGAVARFFGGPTVALTVKLARWITHKTGAVWVDAERLLVAWFSGLYQWAALAIGQALLWPRYVWETQWWVLTKAIPNALRAALRGVHGTVVTVTKVLPKIERTVVKLPRLSKALAAALVSAAVAKWIHPYLSMLRWLRSHFHALTKAINHALPLPTVPSIPNLWKRVRALEKKLAVPVGLGIVAAALARLGLGWIRCNKVRKAGRSICGIDDSLLDELLLGTTAIFGVLSVVEFAKGLQAIEGEAVDLMGKLVREWPA